MRGEVLGIDQSGHLSGPRSFRVGRVTRATSWMMASRLGQSRNLIAATDASGKGGEVDQQGSTVAKDGWVEPARDVVEHATGVSAEQR